MAGDEEFGVLTMLNEKGKGVEMFRNVGEGKLLRYAEALLSWRILDYDINAHFCSLNKVMPVKC